MKLNSLLTIMIPCPCDACRKPSYIEKQPAYIKTIATLQILPMRKMRHLLSLSLFHFAKHGSLLGLGSLNLAFTSSLGLVSLEVHLLLQVGFTGLLSLGSVDVLDQRTLVLEGVTLRKVVEFVVEVLVDLAASTVLD